MGSDRERAQHALPRDAAVVGGALEQGREPEAADRGAAEEPDLEACIVALETAIRGLGNQIGVGLARHLVATVLDLTFKNEHPSRD